MNLKLSLLCAGIVLAVTNCDGQTLSCSALVSNNGTSNENMIDRANNMVRDHAGYLIMAGQTTPSGSSNSDFIISKLNGSCALQWNATYNGTGNGLDEVQDITVDASNNIYVAGNSLGVGSMRDLLTLKINSSGTIQWNSRYDADTYNDFNMAIAYSSTDNTIVTAGWIYFASSPTEIMVRKLNTSTGALVWSATWALASGNVKAYDMAIDNSGNIYVCGEAWYQSGGTKYTKTVLLKYNSIGTLQWSQQYVGTLGASPNIQQNAANKVKIDYLGYIYICGMKSSGINAFGSVNEDVLLIKYNSSGTQQWIASYDRATYGDEAYDLVFDVNNDIALAGRSYSGTSVDFTVCKVSNGGSNLWQTHYDGTQTNSWDEARSIDITGCQNYYVVCGVTQLASGTANYDILSMRLNYSGTVLGSPTYNQAANKWDASNTIIAASGGYWVAGYSTDAGNNSSLTLLKYGWSYIPCERIGGEEKTVLAAGTFSVYTDGGTLTVRLPESQSNWHAVIYNIEGKIISRIEAKNPAITQNISQLANGIYGIKVVSDDGQINQFKKFAVNK